MLLSILFGVVFTIGGLWLSYELDMASGATIILVSGGLFLDSLGLYGLLPDKKSKPDVREARTESNSESPR